MNWLHKRSVNSHGSCCGFQPTQDFGPRLEFSEIFRGQFLSTIQKSSQSHPNTWSTANEKEDCGRAIHNHDPCHVVDDRDRRNAERQDDDKREEEEERPKKVNERGNRAVGRSAHVTSEVATSLCACAGCRTRRRGRGPSSEERTTQKGLLSIRL